MALETTFSGSGQTLTATNCGATNPAVTSGAFTASIFASFKQTPAFVGAAHTPFMFVGSTSAVSFVAKIGCFWASDNSLNCYLGTQGTFVIAGSHFPGVGVKTFWTLAHTYNGTCSQLRIYKNGVQIGAVDAPVTNIVTTGCFGYGGLTGSYDTPKLFTTMLNATTIATLYLGGNVLAPTVDWTLNATSFANPPLTNGVVLSENIYGTVGPLNPRSVTQAGSTAVFQISCPCSSNPCQNGGNCTSALFDAITLTANYTCTCYPGYNGTQCQTTPCATNPCQNGGTCSIASTGSPRVCLCPAEYFGSLCQFNVDGCASSPCMNGGTCSSLLGVFTCQCTGGYFGTRCESAPCQSSPCSNGGTCGQFQNCVSVNNPNLQGPQLSHFAYGTIYQYGVYAGGYQYNSTTRTFLPSKQVWLFDTLLFTWSLIGNMSVSRVDGCLTGDPASGIVLITGGLENGFFPSVTTADWFNINVRNIFSVGNPILPVQNCRMWSIRAKFFSATAWAFFALPVDNSVSSVYVWSISAGVPTYDTALNADPVDVGNSNVQTGCVFNRTLFVYTVGSSKIMYLELPPVTTSVVFKSIPNAVPTVSYQTPALCVGSKMVLLPPDGSSYALSYDFATRYLNPSLPLQGAITVPGVGYCMVGGPSHGLIIGGNIDGVTRDNRIAVYIALTDTISQLANGFSNSTLGYGGCIYSNVTRRFAINGGSLTFATNTGVTNMDVFEELTLLRSNRSCSDPFYNCSCSTGYQGETCQTNLNECASAPCANGGTCTDGVNSFSCACVSGYSGQTCGTDINECASIPCANGGTCTDGVASYTCGCVNGFSGLKCQTNINECASIPCKNGGTCTDGTASFSCACVTGYSGLQCQTDINECASTPCANGGTCTDGVSSYTCACVTGYQGLRCQTDLNECASSPCANGGTCTDGVNLFTCACVLGYSGLRCQTDINECASTPCANGGTCTDAVNSYSCACVQGYSGLRCQTNIDECASAPCKNGATCVDAVNSYTCTCAQGFSGVNCQTDVDECASAPCTNGGTCTDGTASYACTCPSNTFGTRCETALCASQPCQHGATCDSAATTTDCGLTHLVLANPTARSNAAATTINDTGIAIVAGGSIGSGGSLTNVNYVEFFNARTLTWQPGRDALSVARQSPCAAATASFGGLACFAGGKQTAAGAAAFTVVDVYNATSQTWRRAADLSVPRATRFCGITTNGILVVSAGRVSPVSDVLELFNLTASNVTSVAARTLVATRHPAGGGAVYGTRVYFGLWTDGGTDEPDSRSIDMYDTSTGVTTQLPAKMSVVRAGSNAFFVSHITRLGAPYLLVFGDGSASSEAYFIVPGTWSAVAPMLVGSPGAFPAAVRNGNVVYAGDSVADVEIYDSIANTWTLSAEPMSHARLLVAYVGVDDKALFIGGRNTTLVAPDPVTDVFRTEGAPTCAYQYVCNCVPGYSGTVCQTDISECASSPCVNGGSCVDGVNSFVCTCLPGYSGLRCETNINECASIPCANGGTCADGTASYVCACLPGFSGARCQTDVNECASRPCMNGATCTDGVASYSCICAQGFSGTLCETNRNECASHPCKNGATCMDGTDSFSCLCADGYQGITCATDINECASSPCQFNGVCNDMSNGYNCSCVYPHINDPYLLNTRCEQYDICGTLLPCLNNQTCTNVAGNSSISANFTCHCTGVYRGDRCQFNDSPNPCASDPCHSGATCFNNNDDDGFHCVCPFGYTGTLCQTDINGCASTPCANGGTCTDTLAGYTCTCTTAYTGSTCAVDVNECATNNGACQPLAICDNHVGNRTCHCDNPYSGDGYLYCQWIDECDSSPCQNAGDCTDLYQSYSCACQPGFSGSMCQTDINECASQPCLNNGTCHDQPAQWYCICPAGLSGGRCETDINECASVPCQNGGTCNDSIAFFQCRCPSGYSGAVCQTNINECASNPCRNGGTCNDGIASWNCVCAAGYSGLQCQTNIYECASAPCKNGGACIDGIASFTCNCTGTGYTSTLCDVDINECLTNYGGCANGTNCTNTVGSFVCVQCAIGLSGNGIPGGGCTACTAGSYSDSFGRTSCIPCAPGTYQPFTLGSSCYNCDVNTFASEYGATNCSRCDNGTFTGGSMAASTCIPCPDGSAGFGCLDDVDECISEPCMNGGTCHNLNAAFSCACPIDATGALCQTTLNITDSSTAEASSSTATESSSSGADNSSRTAEFNETSAVSVNATDTGYRIDLASGDFVSTVVALTAVATFSVSLITVGTSTVTLLSGTFDTVSASSSAVSLFSTSGGGGAISKPPRHDFYTGRERGGDASVHSSL